MSIYEDDLRPIDLDKVSTYPLASRPSKVTVSDFAQPITEDATVKDYLASLPNILAVQSLRDLAAPSAARQLGKPSSGHRAMHQTAVYVLIDLIFEVF